ncbi:rRNA methyltransferase [Patescibacteria group bacterium AH-259-L07]|nr:rRNA methyltransferase [Patescibacteria group bacterium AH-259-L07]
MKHKTKNIKIYSENNEFQHVEVLKRNRVKRSKNKKFFVEGVKSINLALENQWKIDTFLYSNEKKLSNWAKEILSKSTAKKHIEMPFSLMDKLSGKEDSSELLTLVEMKNDDLDRIKIKKDLFVVVIDRASSPGNLGTILRSCNSFAVDAVIMTGHSVDLYEPKTIQASLGTLFSIPIIRLGSHNDLIPWIKKVKSKIGNFNIIGTTVKTDKTIDKTNFETPLMLLIGNETYGLSSNYKEICDNLVKIPISGSASSLNVACATSIFLYEINKQIK